MMAIKKPTKEEYDNVMTWLHNRSLNKNTNDQINAQNAIDLILYLKSKHEHEATIINHLARTFMDIITEEQNEMRDEFGNK